MVLPENQTGDSGEPSIIAQIVRDVRAQYNIRSDKMLVAGMSAGAAMTIIMSAAYSDLFQAIGISAGLEFRAGNKPRPASWRRKPADPIRTRSDGSHSLSDKFSQ